MAVETTPPPNLSKVKVRLVPLDQKLKPDDSEAVPTTDPQENTAEDLQSSTNVSHKPEQVQPHDADDLQQPNNTVSETHNSTEEGIANVYKFESFKDSIINQPTQVQPSFVNQIHAAAKYEEYKKTTAGNAAQTSENTTLSDVNEEMFPDYSVDNGPTEPVKAIDTHALPVEVPDMADQTIKRTILPLSGSGDHLHSTETADTSESNNTYIFQKEKEIREEISQGVEEDLKKPPEVKRPVDLSAEGYEKILQEKTIAHTGEYATAQTPAVNNKNFQGNETRIVRPESTGSGFTTQQIAIPQTPQEVPIPQGQMGALKRLLRRIGLGKK